MKSILIAIVLCLIAYTPSSAQTQAYYIGTGSSSYTNSSTLDDWYINLEKYWFYRYRLVNDFLCIGPNPGESIPAYRRQNRTLKETTPGNPEPGANSLDFAADAGIDIGNYMAVLATEYKQLKDNGFSTARTLYEIKYAQNAFNRLRTSSLGYYSDITIPGSAGSSPYPYYPYPPVYKPYISSESTSGFFIRDDVPYSTFLHPPGALGTSIYTDPLNTYHWKHFNRDGLYNLYPSTGTYTFAPAPSTTYSVSFSSGGPTHVYDVPIKSANKIWGGCLVGNYRGNDPKNNTTIPTPSGGFGTYPNSESQDQLNQIFVGEMQLFMYLNGTDPEVVDQKQRAETAVFSIINHLDHSAGCSLRFRCIPDPIDPNTYCKQHSSCASEVFRPSAFPAMFGLRGWFYSYGASSSHCTQAQHLQDLARTNSIYYSYASPMNAPVLCCSYPSQNMLFLDTYSCFGAEYAGWNPVPFISWWTWLGASISGKRLKTLKKIASHSWQSEFYAPHTPLLFQLNFGDYPVSQWIDKPIYNDEVRHLLNLAPSCGIWCYENSQYNWDNWGIEDWNNVHGQAYYCISWSGNNRLTDATHRQGLNCYCTLYPSTECHRNGAWCAPTSSGNDQASDCEFNGLDYMWLFNLFALETGSAGTPYLGGMMNSYYCENFNVTYPDPSHIGSFDNKLKLNWLEYVSAKNVINGSSSPAGWVDYRGGRKIDLIPGFYAKPGCFFLAHIVDYSCSGGDIGNGEYHFAELNPTVLRPSRENKGDTIREEAGFRPIMYYKDGYQTPLFIATDTIDNDPTPEDVLANMEYYKEKYKDETIKALEDARNDPDSKDLLGDVDSLANALYPEYFLFPVEVSPNPTDGISNLTYTLPKDDLVKIVLTNSIGQDLNYCIGPYENNPSKGRHSVILYTNQLPPGLYYVTLITSARKVTKKISVIK